MAHYMPWYQTRAVSGSWGWHWTMDHFDPSQQDENGRPQIASQYMPLTGPYDSADPDLLEYQVLLKELEKYNPELLDKARLLAITKSDLLDEELQEEIEKELPEIPYLFISAVTNTGLVRLNDIIWKMLTE